jgi:LAS superfamily LD-carboxypeptidase LdcB
MRLILLVALFAAVVCSALCYDCGQSYVSGRATGQKQCVKINGANVVTTTATAFNKMKAAAAKAGITLHVNSGFRTQAEQQHLYNCYLTKKCNNGNLAAKPGYSNHQNGIALDINVPTSTYNWLVKHASSYGFIRTVPSEKWHWELRPGSRCNAIVKYTCN